MRLFVRVTHRPAWFTPGVAKSRHIELGDGTIIPILYEDRAVLAIDKPSGWLLAPNSWDRTARNLQLALQSSLNAGAFWARCRNLRFLRYVHRLDADTSGLLLLAKSPGALKVFSALFESRRVQKVYLAVVQGVPKTASWQCDLPLAPHPDQVGVMRVDRRQGKPAETRFQMLARGETSALVEARPTTGRTHQVRLHLAARGHPVLHDPLYGPEPSRVAEGRVSLALRAVGLAYPDPFQRRRIRIEAPWESFVRSYGFKGTNYSGCCGAS